jgi:hypothetical protein
MGQELSKVLSPKEQATDIAAFRSGFWDKDRSYSPKARARAERRLSALENTSRAMSTAEFVVALCQITALADNGHSACFYPRGPNRTLALAAFGNEFYVVSASRDDADLVGGRLVAIDGRSISSVRSTVRTMFGGIASGRDLKATDVMARPEILHALGLTTAVDSAAYRVRTTSGKVIERTVRSTRRTPDWISLLPNDVAPWSLQNPGQPFRWRDSPELDAILVQLRRNADAPDKKLADFLDESESNRISLGRRNVVLDMRQNDGGDFLATRDFMLSWPKRVPADGRFFVLMSPATFSAGIASVAYLKQAGGERVVLVGEPPGDRLMFFAEGLETQLPVTRAEVSPAGQRDDFRTGCRGYSDCFAALAQPGAPTGTPEALTALIDEKYGRRPLAVKSLDPDIRAPWTISDYLARRDPAMSAIARYVQAHPH